MSFCKILHNKLLSIHSTLLVKITVSELNLNPLNVQIPPERSQSIHIFGLYFGAASFLELMI